MSKRLPLEDRLFDALGTEWCGGTHPPMDRMTLTVNGTERGVEHVYAVGNDGFELWIGYPDKWLFHTGRRGAKALTWFLIRWWVGEWFGIRRWLWYKLLTRRIARYPRPPALDGEET